jgi:hypothetical protein
VKVIALAGLPNESSTCGDTHCPSFTHRILGYGRSLRIQHYGGTAGGPGAVSFTLLTNTPAGEGPGFQKLGFRKCIAVFEGVPQTYTSHQHACRKGSRFRYLISMYNSLTVLPRHLQGGIGF